MSAFPVKFFLSTMENAPALTPSFGSMISLLDAVLVNGFNNKTVDSISRVGTEVTVNILAGHKYVVNQIVTIAGADQVEYNGEHRVKAVTSTALTFDITTLPTTPATTASSLTIMTSPLGFQKAFAATGLAAYRSTNVLGPRIYLRVDDTQYSGYTTNMHTCARIQICETMSDINTYGGARAPYDPASPTLNDTTDGTYKWTYSVNGTPTEAHMWTLVGDDRGFYFYPAMTSPGYWYTYKIPYAFQEFTSFKTGDAYNVFLACHAMAGDGYSYPTTNGPMDIAPNYDQGKYILRDYTQIGNHVQCSYVSLATNTTTQVYSGYLTGIPWPNGPDFSLILHPVYLQQTTTNHLRGVMPGLYFIHNNNPAYTDGNVISNIAGYPGRNFLIVASDGGGTSSSSTSIRVAIDITGPWR
jgi:hypothetical protein